MSTIVNSRLYFKLSITIADSWCFFNYPITIVIVNYASIVTPYRYLSFGKGIDPSFERTWILFTKECFVPNWPSSYWEDFNSQCFFTMLPISPLGKRVWHFLLNFIYCYQRVICAKFGWYQASGSHGEEDFSVVYVFPLFLLLSPLEEGCDLSFE